MKNAVSDIAKLTESNEVYERLKVSNEEKIQKLLREEQEIEIAMVEIAELRETILSYSDGAVATVNGMESPKQQVDTNTNGNAMTVTNAQDEVRYETLNFSTEETWTDFVDFSPKS